MNNIRCEPRMALRCCDTALQLCSYRYPPAMLAAMASLCDGAAVNWWISLYTIVSKSNLRGFPLMLISVYLVITPHMRTKYTEISIDGHSLKFDLEPIVKGDTHQVTAAPLHNEAMAASIAGGYR